jgi:RimJ/RimL family protein N-acetyltransferase
MSDIRLRAVEQSDLSSLRSCRNNQSDDPFGFFGFSAADGLERAFAVNGLISEDKGTLAVLHIDELVGRVSWFAVQHGPTSACRALNVGMTLIPDRRGQGIGTVAQRVFVDYLFATTTVERLEAGTDVDNVAAQRGLERAGFTREGVLRHAQFRAGGWHDVVLYSRLRGDRE